MGGDRAFPCGLWVSITPDTRTGCLPSSGGFLGSSRDMRAAGIYARREAWIQSQHVLKVYYHCRTASIARVASRVIVPKSNRCLTNNRTESADLNPERATSLLARRMRPAGPIRAFPSTTGGVVVILRGHPYSPASRRVSSDPTPRYPRVLSDMLRYDSFVTQYVARQKNRYKYGGTGAGSYASGRTAVPKHTTGGGFDAYFAGLPTGSM
jgi:hypothetical protein